jgi:hypothetical protein
MCMTAFASWLQHCKSSGFRSNSYFSFPFPTKPPGTALSWHNHHQQELHHDTLQLLKCVAAVVAAGGGCAKGIDRRALGQACLETSRKSARD